MSTHCSSGLHANPGSHWHALPTQVSPGRQLFLQLPHEVAVVVRSAQNSGPETSQQLSPMAQTGPDPPPQWQIMLEQVSSASQAASQAPQCSSELVRFRHDVPQQVDVGLPVQLLPVPPHRQFPELQLSPGSHVVPQLPQLLESV